MALGLVALGVWSFTQLKVEAYPDISDTTVEVITWCPAWRARRSSSRSPSPSSARKQCAQRDFPAFPHHLWPLVNELTFEYGTNDYFARQVVIEKLREAQLPEGITPTLAPGHAHRRVPLQPGRGRAGHAAPRTAGLGRLPASAAGQRRCRSRTLRRPGQAVPNPNRSDGAREVQTLAQRTGHRRQSESNQNAGGALLDNKEQSLAVRGVGLLKSTADIENSVAPKPRACLSMSKTWARSHSAQRRNGDLRPPGTYRRRGRNCPDAPRTEPQRSSRPIHEAVDELNATLPTA